MKPIFCVLLSAFFLFPSVATAAKPIEVGQEGNCRTIFGTVSLEPDPQCGVAEQLAPPGLPGWNFLGPDGCFTVKMKGMVKGKGYSGLTTESTQYQTPTPILLFEADTTTLSGGYMGESRQIMTARSHLEATGGGTLQTADIIVVSAETVTEQLVITGGSGVYENATGSILIDGNTIGEWAPYLGNICLPE